MPMRHRLRLLTLLLTGLPAVLGAQCGSEPWVDPHDPVGRALYASPQVDPIALSPDGSRLYVANTTSDTVSVIDTSTYQVIQDRRVGLEPVSLAVRPDGKELWVSNHVSDSVSVVDTDEASPTLHQVIATIQWLGPAGGTLFDEPVGIAFASNAKAYVALSSRNAIAVVDVASRAITKFVSITAQEPRAITVRNGRLYVAAFESSNQTELSACPFQPINPPQCTLDENDLVDFVTTTPNIPASDTRIVVDPDVPDRDLFVFETANETSVDTVSGLGTLLYGIAVDTSDHVFVTQTDARNGVNSQDGENLIVLANRMFLNRITEVNCGGGSCGAPAFDDIETHPDFGNPAEGDQLATPYGIAISDDDSTLVATAAASSRVFTVNAATGAVRDILDVGAIPRGVALASNATTHAPETAYVLNTLDNTVSVVDVTNPDALAIAATIPVGQDPTPEAVRLGRIAFNDAGASTTGTFSCASCHPDGNNDQLLWRIGGACSTLLDPACGDDEIRSTMPIRGLKNTLPLHWDGTLGDPFGGGNGAVGAGNDGGTSCTLGDADGDHDCFLDLVQASLAGVMCDQDSGSNPAGCPAGGNELSTAEQDDMATFLAGVSYPPARSRHLDDHISAAARDGFAQFFVDQPGPNIPLDFSDAGDLAGVTTCADMDSGCHALPLGADTNSSQLAGFDAPTMRGMTDRTLQFSLGITNSEEALVAAQTQQCLTIQGLTLCGGPPPPALRWDPAKGYDEATTFAAAFGIFEPIYAGDPASLFQMFEEASTGSSGATGRQVTLSVDTTTGGGAAETYALLDALEAADDKGVINLLGNGLHDGTPVSVSYKADLGVYQVGPVQLTRTQVEMEAEAGTLLATLTARLPKNFGLDSHPQPLLAPNTTADGTTGNPDLPVLPGDNPMTLRGIEVLANPRILVDGAVVGGSVDCVGGAFTPFCDSEVVQVTLAAIPSPNDLYLLQLQNPDGPLSNELPICVGAVADCQ
jgi:YVTN family beta-propeller protein